MGLLLSLRLKWEADSADSGLFKHGWKLRTGSTALGGAVLLFPMFHDKLFAANTVNCTCKTNITASSWPILEIKSVAILKMNAPGVCDMCTSST